MDLIRSINVNVYFNSPALKKNEEIEHNVQAKSSAERIGTESVDNHVGPPTTGQWTKEHLMKGLANLSAF